MGILQKNPFSSENSQPIYSLGLNKTVLIVGLGNIGKEYSLTRHNVGFMCVDAFAASNDFGSWTEKQDLKCQVAVKNLGDSRVILAKPTTMMNLSGEAVQAVTRFYKVDGRNLVVVHDDYDVPFGQIRVRNGGSAAGHNGVKSLIQHVGEDFSRIRIGIKPSEETRLDMSDFVLADFSAAEQQLLPRLENEVTSILTEYVYGGQLNPQTRSF